MTTDSHELNGHLPSAIHTESIQDNAAETYDSATSPRKHIGPKAFIGTFSTSALIQAGTLVQAILLARILGPTGRGELATIILWPTFIGALGLFGTNIAIARCAAKVSDLNSVTRSALLVGLVTAVLTTITCYLLLPMLMPGAKHNLLAIAKLYLVFILLSHLASNLMAIDQGAANFRRLNLIRIIFNPVFILCLLILWIVGLNHVLWISLAMLFSYSVFVLVLLCSFLRNCELIGKLYPPIKIAIESVSFGIVGIVNVSYEHTDKLLLLWLLGTRDLGLYTVALAVSSAVLGALNSTKAIVFTMAAQTSARSGFEKIGKVFRMVALLSLFIGGFLALCIPYLLPFVYGRSFAEAISPTILLIAGSVFARQASLLDESLRGQGRPFGGVKGRLAGILAMLVVGYFTSRIWGIIGICIAYIASKATFMIVLILQAKSHYRVPTLFVFIPSVTDLRELVTKIGDILVEHFFSKTAQLKGVHDTYNTLRS